MGISGISGDHGFAIPPWKSGGNKDIVLMLKAIFSNPLNPNGTEELQLRRALNQISSNPETPQYQQDIARHLHDKLDQYHELSHKIQSYKQDLKQPGLPKEQEDQLIKLLGSAEKQQEEMQASMSIDAQKLMT